MWFDPIVLLLTSFNQDLRFLYVTDFGRPSEIVNGPPTQMF
jgi:hypothetical protein